MKLARLLRRDPAAPTLRERAAALREGLNRRKPAPVKESTSAVASDGHEAHPDTALMGLWQRREEAHSAAQAAAIRWNTIDDAETPGVCPKPEALFIRDEDEALGIAKFAFRNSERRMWYCVGDPSDADRYRAGALRKPRLRTVTRPIRPEDNLPADARAVVSNEPWPAAQARADEIVTAWDRWKAEIARRNEASGFDAAKADWQVKDRILAAIDDEIAAAEARTITGLTIQARVALHWEEGGFRDADTLAVKVARGLVSLDTTASSGGLKATEPAVEPRSLDLIAAAGVTLSSLSLKDVAALHEISATLANVVRAMSCQPRSRSGPHRNDVAKFVDWLGDQLDAQTEEAFSELRGRVPADWLERDIRLEAIAETIISNGDPAELGAFARELLAAVDQ